MRKVILVALLCLVSGAPPALAQAGSMRNGLPPTSMDSFVYEAAGMQDLIYGDEGVQDIPPYFEFTPENRINSGSFGTRDAGLTTGHSTNNGGQLMPCAW